MAVVCLACKGSGVVEEMPWRRAWLLDLRRKWRKGDGLVFGMPCGDCGVGEEKIYLGIRVEFRINLRII